MCVCLRVCAHKGALVFGLGVGGTGAYHHDVTLLCVVEYWPSTENSPKMFTSVIPVHVLDMILMFVKKDNKIKNSCHCMRLNKSTPSVLMSGWSGLSYNMDT